MKIAQLPNGHQITFPPETPDEEMDAHVQRYLGGQAPAAPDMSAIEPLIMAFSQHLAQQGAAKSAQKAEADQNRQVDMEMRQADSAMRQQGMQEKMAVLQGLSATIQQVIAPPLNEIAQNSQRIEDLIGSINNLSATLVDAVNVFVTILKLPREIYNDDQNVPKGIRIKN